MPRRKVTVRHYYLGPFTERFTESREALEGDGSLSLERLEEEWGVRRLIAFVKIPLRDDETFTLNRCKGVIPHDDLRAGLSFADYISVTDHVLLYPGPLNPPSEMTLLYNRFVRWWTTSPTTSSRKDS